MAGNTPLSFIKDINGALSNFWSGLTFSDVNQDVLLTVDVVKTVTVPATLVNNKYLALFTYSDACDVFVLPAASPTLTVPTGTVRTTLAQFRPAARIVVPGQVIQLIYHDTSITNRAVNVSISYYAISPSNLLG